MTDSVGGTTTYVYDAANRLTSLQFGGPGQTPLRLDMTYTARERARDGFTIQRPRRHAPGGHLDLHLRRRRPTHSVLQQDDGTAIPLASYVYTYDAAGNLTSETLNGGRPRTYTYDATNQLTSDTTTTYSYDANGNRTMAGYSTGADNQITTDGTWTYTYDNEGNLIKKIEGVDGRDLDLRVRQPESPDPLRTGRPTAARSRRPSTTSTTSSAIGSRRTSPAMSTTRHPVRLRRPERLGRPRREQHRRRPAVSTSTRSTRSSPGSARATVPPPGT